MAASNAEAIAQIRGCYSELKELEEILEKPHLNREEIKDGLELCKKVERRVNFADRALWKSEQTLRLRMEEEAKRAAEAATAAALEVTRAAAANGTLRTVEELMQCVSNQHQLDTLARLTRRSEAERLYLVDYVPNVSADRKKAHVQGAFTLLGSVNAKGERSQYTVSFYKDGAKPSPFWCTCPEHKFKSAKQGTLCKHISFIVLRYAKFMDPAIFANRTLSSEQHAKLCDMLSRPLKESADSGLVAFAASVADYAVAADREFAEDDVCAICYETLSHEAELCGCPTCRSAFHCVCNALWLAKRESCVMCRSECWKAYKQAKHIGA
jgi:hypothetical protein